MPSKIFNPYRLRFNEDKRDNFKYVFDQLEKTGRALCNGSISRQVSSYIRNHTSHSDKFRFGYTSNKESIVIIKPGYVLIRTPKNKYTIKRDNRFTFK